MISQTTGILGRKLFNQELFSRAKGWHPTIIGTHIMKSTVVQVPRSSNSAAAKTHVSACPPRLVLEYVSEKSLIPSNFRQKEADTIATKSNQLVERFSDKFQHWEQCCFHWKNILTFDRKKQKAAQSCTLWSEQRKVCKQTIDLIGRGLNEAHSSFVTIKPNWPNPSSSVSKLLCCHSQVVLHQL